MLKEEKHIKENKKLTKNFKKMKMNKLNKVILLPFCAAFVACSDYDPMDMTVQQAATINEYTKNFVARYGNIDPNHTWGFGNIPSASTSMFTRAELGLEGNSSIKPPTPIGKDKNGKDTDELQNVKNAFAEAKESDDVYFIWGTYYVQNVYSTAKDNDEKVYFAARNYVYSNPNADGYYSKTTEHSELNNHNDSESPYIDKGGNSFAMFAGMRYNSDDTAPQFVCVDEKGDIKVDKNGNIVKCIILKVGDSFYLGFDLDGNGCCNDWIVKLIPAGENSELPVYRIMCEDLGSTSDFDFNDIVFDVDASTYYDYTVDENGQKVTKWGVTITIQAAGGTMPVYIGNTNPNNEVHYILTKDESEKNSDNKIPVNVKYRGKNSIPARVKTITGLPDNKPISIPLYRKSSITDTSKNEATTELAPNEYTEKIPENTQGIAPFKICVPVSTKWTVENGDIGEAYDGFDAWVQDEQGNTQYKEDGAGFSKTPGWVEKIKNESLLMEPNPTE